VALNLNLFITSSMASAGRIAAYSGVPLPGEFIGNFGNSAMTNDAFLCWTNSATDKDGGDVALTGGPAAADDVSWWTTTGPGWTTIHPDKATAESDAQNASPTSPWYWDGSRPKLWFE
jgi:hypothetical protein